MNEAQMRSLVSVVKHGSINAAARELFITPPSLHQRLGALESELGCSLLERGPRGVSPTEAGMRVYEACERCVRELDAARRDVARMVWAGDPSAVRIGTAWRPSLRVYYLIESLHETRPELNVSVVKVSDKGLADALLDGDIDLFEGPRVSALDAMPLEFCTFGPDDVRCVCGPESRWARDGAATLASLSQATVYAGSDYRTYHSYRDCAAVQAFCARENFKSTPYPTEQIVSDCMNGSAVVLFSASRADDLCPPLTHVPIDMPPVESGVYTRTNPSPGVALVVEALREGRVPNAGADDRPRPPWGTNRV